MLKKILIFFSITLILAVLIFGIHIGAQEQVDHDWFALDTLLKSKNLDILTDKEDALQKRFIEIQKDTLLHKINVFKFLKDPFLPTLEYKKYINFFNTFYEKKRIIVSGVTGAGKTTLIDRAAKMLTGSNDRILYLQCVEKMEVELHKEYIGIREQNKFYPGKLLLFIEKCQKDSLHNYVFFIDDIDKIYPATFFGAALWNELDNESYTNTVDGYCKDFNFPGNLYIVAGTHTGVGSTIKLGFEVYRRLGNNLPYYVSFDAVELFLYIKQKSGTELEKDSLFRLHTKKVLYFFNKANQYILENYGESYVLGQWTPMRRFYKPEKYSTFVNCFVENINTLSPERPIQASVFNPINYTIQNDGKIYGSSYIAKLYNSVLNIGIIKDFSVAILCALGTGLFGLYQFYKKKVFIRNLVIEANIIVDNYEKNGLTNNAARGKLLDMMHQIDQHIIKKKINYPEGNYLFNTIRHQLTRIEESYVMKNASAELSTMFDSCMSDGHLDEKEYELLSKFVQSLKYMLNTNEISTLRNKIDLAFYQSEKKLNKS